MTARRTPRALSLLPVPGLLIALAAMPLHALAQDTPPAAPPAAAPAASPSEPTPDDAARPSEAAPATTPQPGEAAPATTPQPGEAAPPTGAGPIDPAAQQILLERIDEARLLVGQQKYPEAIAAYRGYLTSAPEDLQATLELARVLSWTQAYDDSLTLYDGLLQQLPDDTEIQLERARVMLWALRYDEAIDALEDLKARHAPALTQASGDEAIFSPALASQGPDALAERIDRSLADGYAWSGRMDRAIPLYERLWDLHPEDRPLGLNYARALSSRRSYPEALEVYDRLLAQDPGDPPFRMERARVMLWAERYDDGLDALLKLRRELQDALQAPRPGEGAKPGTNGATGPNGANGVNGAKAAANGAKATADAAQAPATPEATKALLDEVTRLLAAGYSWNREYAKAAQEYGVLVAEHPTEADLKLELARVLRDLKYYDAALAQYSRYLELRPRDLMAEIERTRVALWAGRYPESIRSFQKLKERLETPTKSDEITDVERNRYLNEVNRQLTRAYLWSGRPAEALPFLNALIKATPDDVELTLELARALAQAGRLEQARETYARYQAMGGTAESAALGEGQTYQWEGDLLRARRAYQRALEETPGSEAAARALAAIEPEMRWPTSGELRMRMDGLSRAGDAGGLQLLQTTFTARTELPYGLLWVAPSIDLDGFTSDNGSRFRFSPVGRVRYRHDARWSAKGELGLEVTPGSSPVTLRMAAEGRWSPGPSLRLDVGGRFGDAVGTLFSWGSIAERFRQLEGVATASWTPLLLWEVWGQARAGWLYKPERLCGPGELCTNGFVQLQGAVDRGFMPGGLTDRVLAGLSIGLVHFAHQDGDYSYWSPAIYATVGPRASVGLRLPRDLQLRLRARVALAYASDVERFFPELSGEAALEQRLSARLGWKVEGSYGRTARLDEDELTASGAYWSGLVLAQGWYRF